MINGVVKWVVKGDDRSRISVPTHLVILEHAAGVVVVGGGVIAQGHVCHHAGDGVLTPDPEGHLGIQTAYTLNNRVY